MKLPKHLLGLSKGQLESMCVDCGLCCHAQVEVSKGQTVLVPELRCKHLVTKSEGESCCSVYEDRQEVAKGWCFPLAEAINKGLFPKACPYVAEMTDYVGAQVMSDAQYEQMKPALKKAIVFQPMPEWVDPNQFAEFLDGREALQKSSNFDPNLQQWYLDNEPEVFEE